MSIPALNAPAIPLVGQPLTVVSATILPVVQCHCEHGGTLVLVATISAIGVKTTPELCPSCGKRFLLRGIATDAHGQLSYTIDMSDPPKDS